MKYIGWLSRFEGAAPSAGVIRGEAVDLLVLLSGPEPQRSILEKKVMEQAVDYSGRVVLVGGLPDGKERSRSRSGDGFIAAPSGELLAVPPRVRVYNHLPADELAAVMRGAGQIICRAGYSTVMDLVRLGRRAIMIPTPGQTEQEYLGRYLASRGWAVCVDQKGFSLMDALAAAKGEGRRKPEDWMEEGMLREAIAEVLAQVRDGG